MPVFPPFIHFPRPCLSLHTPYISLGRNPSLYPLSVRDSISLSLCPCFFFLFHEFDYLFEPLIL